MWHYFLRITCGQIWSVHLCFLSSQYVRVTLFKYAIHIYFGVWAFAIICVIWETSSTLHAIITLLSSFYLML